LAEAVGAEIVSVDSMQVYRSMDIGTAKPSAAERARVRHHMIDVADPGGMFTVAEFQRRGRAALDSIGAGIPLVAGGSGLHFRALVDPLRFPPTDAAVRREIEAQTSGETVAELLAADPDAAEHVDLENPRRVVRALEVARLTGLTPTVRAVSDEGRAVREYRPLLEFVAVGIDAGDSLAERVTVRLEEMIDRGLLDEVEGLRGRMGPAVQAAVGYRQLLRVVEGEWSLDEGIGRARDATRALARRQRTFFRRDPRIRWVEWDDDPARRLGSVRAALEEAGWTS